MPEETLSSEAADAANLNSMQRGQLAELIFMRKASSLGFSVSKPAKLQMQPTLTACKEVSLVETEKPKLEALRMKSPGGKVSDTTSSSA